MLDVLVLVDKAIAHAFRSRNDRVVLDLVIRDIKLGQLRVHPQFLVHSSQGVVLTELPHW